MGSSLGSIEEARIAKRRAELLREARATVRHAERIFGRDELARLLGCWSPTISRWTCDRSKKSARDVPLDVAGVCRELIEAHRNRVKEAA